MSLGQIFNGPDRTITWIAQEVDDSRVDSLESPLAFIHRLLSTRRLVASMGFCQAQVPLLLQRLLCARSS
jgi:hypothetical protein